MCVSPSDMYVHMCAATFASNAFIRLSCLSIHGEMNSRELTFVRAGCLHLFCSTKTTKQNSQPNNLPTNLKIIIIIIMKIIIINRLYDHIVAVVVVVIAAA